MLPGTVLGMWSAAVVTVALATTACDNGEVAPRHRPAPEVASVLERLQPLPNAPEPLVTPTYDGSGQAVEPTVLYFADAWHGHHYWMAVSPYPNGDAAFENPSILVSEDGLAWSVPDGLTNPLVLPEHGELSDATLVHDEASDQLWVYYLDDVREHGVDVQSMHRLTSADGIRWSAPELILRGKNYPLQSPSVVATGGTFTMWTVDAGARGCRARSTTVHERSSTDGLHWTEPRAVSLTQPGYVIWHFNMIQVPATGHFLSLLAAYPQGKKCNRTRLFLADSDGQRWETYGQALLVPGSGWDDQEIYRSSLLYDPATRKLRVWYSARQLGTDAWHLGYTEGFPLP